jgi:hypothetical protein
LQQAAMIYETILKGMKIVDNADKKERNLSNVGEMNAIKS